MSRRRSIWPTPSSTSGRAGRPASALDSVRTCWQKLWKLLTLMRARTAGPTVSSRRRLELLRGLDVVGQDEDLLRDERAAEGVAVAGRGLRREDAGEVPLRLQQPADALHDDARLAGPGAGDDHDGAIVRLDDRALLGGERVHHSSPILGHACDRLAVIARRGPTPLSWTPTIAAASAGRSPR